jgi:hypothetical protein
LKVKHHDPIPDIEWWDAVLLPKTRRTYILDEDTENPENRFDKLVVEGVQ